MSHPDPSMPSSSAEGGGSQQAASSSSAVAGGGARHKRRQGRKPDDEEEDDGGIEVAEYVNVPDYGLYPSSESENKSLTNNQKGKSYRHISCVTIRPS